MMPRCSASGCRNGSERVGSAVTFYPFPAQAEAAERWAGLCGASGQERTQLQRDIEQGSSGKYFVCSLHFEDDALERSPAGECRLRQGAEPTLFPCSPQDKALEDEAQADGVLPGPQGKQTPSSAASHSPSSRSVSQTSRTTQVLDTEESPGTRVSCAEHGTRVSECPPAVHHLQSGASQIVLNFREQSNGLTVDSMPERTVSQCHEGCHSLQRVVQQIVLLFLDRPCESAKQTSQGPPLTVSSKTQTEGTRQHGKSHYPPSPSETPVLSQTCEEPVRTMCSSTHTECPSRPEGLNHPPSHPQVPYTSRPEPVHTVTSSNQGDGTRRCLEVNYRSPNMEIQMSPQLCVNSERSDDSATPSRVMDSPGTLAQSPTDLLIHQPSDPEPQALLSCQEPTQTRSSSTQTEATTQHVGQSHLPPTAENQLPLKSFQCSSTQTEPPEESSHDSDGGTRHRSHTEYTLTLDSWTQTQKTDGHGPGHVRECDVTPERPPYSYNQRPCGISCLTPALTQYVGNLLEHHKVSLQDSGLHPCIPPSSASPCPPQHRVRQIVLNFLEQDCRPVTQDVPFAATCNDLSSPDFPAHQHQETQTSEELLQPLNTPKEKPGRPFFRPRRPSQSRSCPPSLTGCVTPPLPQQEESRLRTAIRDESVPQPRREAWDGKVTFQDIVIYFCKEEWQLLRIHQRALYREVMSDNYRSLLSLGLLVEKPDLMARIERQEEDLWEDETADRRLRHQAAEYGCFPDLGTGGARFLDNDGTTANPGRASVESSSHLGALMRLVSEIPGFLLGGSVADGGFSPARSLEDHENIGPCSVKTEESSPACTPASAHAPHPVVTPESAASPGLPRDTEERHRKVTVKVEEQVVVTPTSRHGAPFCQPSVLPLCIKRDPGTSAECVQGKPQIKQEDVPAAASSAHSFIVQQRPRISHLPTSSGPRHPHPPDNGRRPSSRGGTSAWAAVPLNRSTGSSPRNPSVSPASLCDGTSSAELGDLKIKIKQEDSGSERESPCGGKRVYNSPMSSPSAVRQPERDHWRPGSSPRKSPADNIPLGASPLHRLVTCLKEISAGHPRAHNTAITPASWGTDANRICTEAPVRVSGPLGSWGPEIPATKPNPFTVAVTNGAGWLKSRETKTLESRSTRLSRDETKLDRFRTHVPSGQNMGSGFQRSEESRRPELGVKRTHSDDLSRLPGVMSGAKRPAVETSSSSSRAASSCSPSRYDTWRPPGELQRALTNDQPIGKSHLMSVMDCVRKIPGCRPNPPLRVPGSDLSRTPAQGSGTEGKLVAVKEEKVPSPHLPAASQWLQPPRNPDTPEQSGTAATNVHLTGLMRLMEEIPCAESSSSSRTMYSIAVGHTAGARRPERPNYCNDDGSFQSELNENTIASVDSVFSDDTSWSSENVDPSYSAIGGLQKVVSEFAELGSVSPLVAVTAPPVSASIQEAYAQKKSKEPVTTISAAPVSHPSEGVRRSVGGAPGSAASTCSAENGAAAYAALCGLQKVVHGFVEQECVSPISAVRNNPPNASLRDCSGKRPTYPEEEAESPCLQEFSPALTSRFLCDSGNWMSETDSSYSALSGLQKVVNGFSEMSCVSPFSAVSTTASEPPAQDSSYSTPSGLKKVVNGVPDISCISPVTVASNLSSEGEPDPSVKRRCDRENVSRKYASERQSHSSNAVPTHDDSGHSHDSYCSPRKTPGSSSHCIDLTQEEEPHCGKSRSSTQEGQRKRKMGEELPSSQSLNTFHNRASGVTSSGQVSSIRTTSAQVSIGPTSSAQISSARTSSAQVSSVRTSSAQVSIGPTSSAQVSIGPTSSAQVSNSRASSAQVSSSRASSAQVSSSRAFSTQVSSSRASSGQCIDLTEEEEMLTNPKALSAGVPGTSSHSDSPQKRSLAERKHRPCIDLTQAQRLRMDKAQDPWPPGPNRGGVPVVNEHLSGLEKLLKGVPTFTPTNHASAQKWNGSWWFRSTSPHET
ncbi:uncharacterized protein LOC134928664 isoform X2 [Pseudophryne corroboree]|uniref:uncharacterized protein LOC134928664 isoform X2 n=1 Tax=Pseudophryne corroboree TaxID=495146 RepID=UPI0030820110